MDPMSSKSGGWKSGGSGGSGGWRSGDQSEGKSGGAIRLVVALAITAWLGCAQPQTRTSRPELTVPVRTAVRDEETRLFAQTVADLAAPTMEGRGTGTAGLDRARDYLVERFGELGLEPAFRVDGQPSFTQPFTAITGVQAKHQTLEMLDPQGRVLTPTKQGEHFNALGFSASGAFEGPIVFVGYGIVDEQHGYDSYAQADPEVVRGRVAIAFRFEPQDPMGKSLWARREGGFGPWTEAASLVNKARWAAQRGAAALLVVDPPVQDHGDLKSTRYSFDAAPASIPVIHIRSGLFRAILAQAGRDPQSTLEAYQEQANRGGGSVDPIDGAVLRGRVEIETQTTTLANVGGLVRGCGSLADQIVVVGAHYDHLGFGDPGRLGPENVIYPGADDNASGTAGLLLLARRAVEQRNRLAGTPPSHQRGVASRATAEDHRTILFVAFSGEERGLLGSSYLVKHEDQLNLDEHRTVAMINLDMIGRMRGDRLFALGVGSGDLWERWLTEVAASTGLNLSRDPVAFGASDQLPFYNDKVPVLHLFTGVHDDYHRPTDTPEKINAEGGVRVVQLVDALLQRARTGTDTIAFVPDATPFDPHGVGMAGAGGPATAYLGVVPDYATLYGNEGCAIAGVSPGSPAQAAGLQAGDVILRWNQSEVGNVYGLSAALRASSPGDPVRLTVRRGDQTLQLQATLGRR